MKNHIVESLILAVSIVLLGALFHSAIVYTSDKDRSVTVRGLAVTTVPADNAVWNLNFQDRGNDLPDLYKSIEKKNGIIVQFLKDCGFDEKEISVSSPNITDLEDYSEKRPQYRYRVASKITLLTGKVNLVRSAIMQQRKLVEQGIVLERDYGGAVSYSYTNLNEIKPKMIEEATHNARQAAEKFAKDSDSKLGKIRVAYQGQFSIDDRDESTPYIKKIRVVTSVQYSLED